ncbi:MAG: hypothetical protein JWM80_1317 [Cyanobacteria bacterium RYN_339]|nr:hypothetical protein [Cyanobacteria bacterium RYN_339]
MARNLLFALVTVLLATPAAASTMPKADFGGSPVLGLGLGYGVGVSIDAPVAPQLSLGVAAHFAYFNTVHGDVRLLYKLLHGGGGLTLDLLGGVGYGGLLSGGGYNPSPFVGVALAYPFTHQLTGRLNVGINPLSPAGTTASGIELGYKFSNTLEGTIGANGLGDVLGLKLYI